MPISNEENNNNLFYSTDDGKTFKSISEISSISVTLTEESAAKLWAICQGGIEIVRNEGN